MVREWMEDIYAVGLDRIGADQASSATGPSRGTFRIQERIDGRLYALIGSRWCRIARNADGKLVEVWTR